MKTLAVWGAGKMNSRSDFNKVAGTKKEKPLPPFSLRLTREERAQLENEAAGLPLGTYIRKKLLGKKVSPRRNTGRYPVKDHEALGRVLGALGSSRISSNLNQLAKAVNTGSLPVTPDTEIEIKKACAEVELIRRDMMLALGTGSEPKP